MISLFMAKPNTPLIEVKTDWRDDATMVSAVPTRTRQFFRRIAARQTYKGDILDVIDRLCLHVSKIRQNVSKIPM